jgi:presenilin-like A22 family membrane protease
MNRREAGGVAVAVGMFLLVQLGALALVPTFFEQGYQTVEDPSNPANSLLYVAAILVATGVMLAAFRYGLDQLIRALIVFSSGLLSWYVFGAVVPPLLGPETGGLVALVLAAAVAVALLVYPEWYVIDTAGVLMGAGAGGLFGISFGLLPAIVLLTVLAVYDAISVYRTGHMLDLAEGVMGLRIPVVLVVPLTLSYSLLDEDFSSGGDEDPDAAGAVETDGAGSEADHDGGPEQTHPETPIDDAGEFELGEGRVTDDERADEDEGGRDAFFVGLGDAVMPTVMVASAAFFSPAPALGSGALAAVNLPALLAMVGTILGLLVLMRMVTAGRAHAGLPLLNGGAIGGYLLGSLLAGVPLLTALGL